jgi:hypothetical protein
MQKGGQERVAQPAAVELVVVRWDKLFRQLVDEAGRRARGRIVDGKWPEDFASEVFLRFLLSEDGFGWSPGGSDPEADLQDLVKRLLRVLHWRITDAFRRDQKIGACPGDFELLRSADDIERKLITDELVEQIARRVLRGKRSKNERLKTIFRRMLDGETRAEILAETGLDPAVVDPGMKLIRAEARSIRDERQPQ